MSKAKKIGLSLAGLALLALSTGRARAGLKQSTDVVLNPSAAYGDLAAVRASADSTAYIGCYLVIQNASPSYMGCTAVKNGVSKFCTTTNSSYFWAVAAITSNSLISFEWNASGQCVAVQVRNNSSYPVVAP